jgi:hypothetical protein
VAFSDEIVREAWKRSGGKCERCGSALLWTLQGGELSGGWRVCRKTLWAPDVIANAEIRCAACQKPLQPVRVQ